MIPWNRRKFLTIDSIDVKRILRFSLDKKEKRNHDCEKKKKKYSRVTRFRFALLKFLFDFILILFGFYLNFKRIKVKKLIIMHIIHVCLYMINIISIKKLT